MAKKNQQKISVPRLITSIALAMILMACVSPSEDSKIDITLQPTLSAQAYLDKADTLRGSDQSNWLIMALKAAIKEANSEQAAQLIRQIKKQPLSEMQLAEWQLAQAEYMILNGQPKEALEQLHFTQQQWQLLPLQWQNYHLLRAQLFEQNNHYFQASRELSFLSDYIALEERGDIAARIWSNLSRYSESEITAFSAQEGDPELAPWLELAASMKTERDISKLQQAIQLWFKENSTHTAAVFTPAEITTILELEMVDPKNTALLLPLSGKFEKQAELIRDGFLMVLMDDKARKEDAALHIIDTNKLTTSELFSALQEKEVDFIVGPLVKSKIEDLLEIRNTQAEVVPMLALNIPAQIGSHSNTCFFTLSPEQEVQQAAKYLFEQGFEYPLILAPKGAIGERVAIAFQNEWQKYSRNQAAVSYFGEKGELQKDVNRTFGIEASQNRISQMRGILKRNLEHQARSRRDIDAVYMVAKSSELTLIKPFMEVILNPEAKPPKLFTNSRSNNGVKRQHEDLTGIVFSDIPMLIEKDAELDAKMEQLWPKQSYGQRRLQALGMDAYHLINELPQMKAFSDYQVKGQTGLLRVDEQCIIQREISWSEHE